MRIRALVGEPCVSANEYTGSTFTATSKVVGEAQTGTCKPTHESDVLPERVCTAAGWELLCDCDETGDLPIECDGTDIEAGYFFPSDDGVPGTVQDGYCLDDPTETAKRYCDQAGEWQTVCAVCPVTRRKARAIVAVNYRQPGKLVFVLLFLLLIVILIVMLCRKSPK